MEIKTVNHISIAELRENRDQHESENAILVSYLYMNDYSVDEICYCLEYLPSEVVGYLETAGQKLFSDNQYKEDFDTFKKQLV